MPGNYNELDMDSRLTLNLRNLGHRIRFLFEGKGSQRRILIILYEIGDISQRELTEKLDIRPGSASEVIGKLESAGLIRRTPSQTDRRTADIRLTPAGRSQAEEALKQRKIRHKEMFSCMSEEEKTSFLALMEKLNADWADRYFASGRGPDGQDRECHGHSGRHGGRRHDGDRPEDCRYD